jgi:hypothetical protein
MNRAQNTDTEADKKRERMRKGQMSPADIVRSHVVKEFHQFGLNVSGNGRTNSMELSPS